MARLLLIGPFVAEADEEPPSSALIEAIDKLTPSDLALLVLLARYPSAHRRQELIEAMWPENKDWEIDFEAHLREEPEATARQESRSESQYCRQPAEGPRRGARAR
jgi:hypothetical protein